MFSSHFSSAALMFFFKGITFPPLIPSSAVITNFESQSWMRPAIDSGAKPPNITE